MHICFDQNHSIRLLPTSPLVPQLSLTCFMHFKTHWVHLEMRVCSWIPQYCKASKIQWEGLGYHLKTRQRLQHIFLNHGTQSYMDLRTWIQGMWKKGISKIFLNIQCPTVNPKANVQCIKIFLPALDGAVWFHCNLGSEHTGEKKLQRKRCLEFYQRVFANLDGSQANRSLIKSLCGEFTQAGPENSGEGFTGHPGWAQAPSRSISPS